MLASEDAGRKKKAAPLLRVVIFALLYPASQAHPEKLAALPNGIGFPASLPRQVERLGAVRCFKVKLERVSS